MELQLDCRAFSRARGDREQAAGHLEAEVLAEVRDVAPLEQVDDPDLPDGWQMYPGMSVTQYRDYAELRVDALNHEFVPAFNGRMAVVIAITPTPVGVSARVEICFRADSRFVGPLARTCYPLVRSKAEHRVSANLQDFCAILHDLSAAPQQTVSRLNSKEDAVALSHILTSISPQQGPEVQKSAPAKKD